MIKTRFFKFIFSFLILIATNKPTPASDAFSMAGDILSVALPLGAAGVTAYYRDWDGTVQFAKSFVANEVVTYSLKYTVNEKRPNGGDYSFPSGHTSVSVVSAEFLRKHYGWWYGIPCYAVAAFVGYSRVEAHYHYAHDVAAGAAIGFLSAFVFTKTYKGVTVKTVSDGNYLGVLAQGTF